MPYSLWYVPERNHVPIYMVETVEAYVNHGRPVGGFLYAVLTNNLCETVFHADATNARLLKEWAMLLLDMPVQAWGSRDAVGAWQAHGGLAGLNARTGTK